MATIRISQWLVTAAVITVSATATLFSVIIWHNNSNGRERLALAKTHSSEGEFESAWQLSQGILKEPPHNAVARAPASLAAQRLQREQASEKLFADLPPSDGSLHVYNAWMDQAEMLAAQGRIDDAVTLLHRLLSSVPDDPLILRRLAELNAGCRRHVEALWCLRRLVELGHASPRELTTLAMNGEDPWDFDRVLALRERCLTDQSLVLAHAIHLRLRLRLAEARALLDEALNDPPFDTALLALRIELADDDVSALYRLLPRTEQSATVWSLRARHSESGNLNTAVDCAFEALKLDPFNRELNHILGSLVSRSASFREETYQQRFELLTELHSLCRSRNVFGTSKTMQCVTLLRKLGRNTEAVAWCRTMLRTNPAANSDWARMTLAQLPLTSVTAKELEVPAPFSYGDFAPRSHADTPNLPHNNAGTHIEINPRLASSGGIQLQDVASDVALDFQFYNGTRSAEPGRRMYEFTGGGVGVLDLDGDTWPDLFFSQGADWPAGHPNAADTGSVGHGGDRLFRNYRGQSFADISEAAGIADRDFGQGVGVGDVNNDGFDDVYVANFGHNTLWINQGDGTFVRRMPNPNSAVWTISVAIADINGDAIPDLYDVNYLAGNNVFTYVCEHEGQPGVCGPTDFPAEQDVLMFGTGDGEFQPAGPDSGIVQPDGRGMGIVVGDLVQNGNVQIVIANDESANFFFEPDEDGRLQETGVLRGLAYGRSGESQGSMGIAVGNVDCNCRADLFLTNYYAEDNCLHLQTRDGFFPDGISQSDLAVPGRSMLGFGTQFFDADNDGDDDLFVANGHLDDFTHLGAPFQMRPQLFENLLGIFRECNASTSEYLAQSVLGRAVARLDWNRDGRTDLCVTHLDRPVALLENRSDDHLRPFVIRYIGVTQSRDAVGTVFRSSPEVETQSRIGSSPGDPRKYGLQDEERRKTLFPDGRPAAHSIVAGDGYQCSNERLLKLVVPRSTRELSVAARNFWVNDTEIESACVRLQFIERRPAVWRIPE